MNEFEICNNNRSNPVLVICGPTASGKTSLAIEAALSDISEAGAEIVSADSMQIYRGFDIGTAKASPEERKNLPHHMIDICDPEDFFSVAQYKMLATKCIRDIQNRNKLAILCGGTGQYLSALIDGIDYVDMPVDLEIRNILNRKAEEAGNEALLKELSCIDSDTAERLSVSDRKRIVRALEIYYTTGITQSEANRKSKLSGPDFKYVSICINLERQKLYEKINSRVLEMFEEGWVEEVKTLLSHGVSKDCTSMQAIGYRQIISFLNNETSLENTISEIQQATRRYAKRQLTWFRGMKQLIWIDYKNIQDDNSKRLNYIRHLLKS